VRITHEITTILMPAERQPGVRTFDDEQFKEKPGIASYQRRNDGTDNVAEQKSCQRCTFMKSIRQKVTLIPV